MSTLYLILLHVEYFRVFEYYPLLPLISWSFFFHCWNDNSQQNKKLRMIEGDNPIIGRGDGIFLLWQVVS